MKPIAIAAAGAGVSTDEAAGGTAQAMTEARVVVFGRNDSGKAHASRLGEADAEMAIRAAGLMGFKVLPITSDEHRAAASAVAAGWVLCVGPFSSPVVPRGRL